MRLNIALFFLLLLSIASCSKPEPEPKKIAFLADVHLTNIFGALSDSDFEGAIIPGTDQRVIARTMSSQLQSTRIFNENYFSFLAALDDIAERGISLVAFPGDYTDDGQPIHVRGLREILQKYEEEHGMQFFITTGNHDPVQPFYQDAGKRDFLGENGKNQPIFSREGMYSPNPEKDNPMIISQDVAEMGYEGILGELGTFGFLPQENYVFWSTPFSGYSINEYSFDLAKEAGDLANRSYEVAPGFTVPDVTYLVEPVEGIWLLAIDGNIYVPRDLNGAVDDTRNYGSPSVGFNNMSDNKDYLIDWVSEISLEAKQRGKMLIVFSHYPMVDFNDDASPILRNLLGGNRWQLARVPEERIAETFADAGVQIHIAGHMHINDTGVRTTSSRNSIVNIQTPSLAAYRPGYKILTLHPDQTIEVETVTIDSVPGFKQLFPLYEVEYAFLQSIGDDNIWNREVMEAETYHDFILWHLKELVRLRFINDWPEPIKTFLSEGTLEDIAEQVNYVLPREAENYLSYDMLLDFYKLRNADVLALEDISIEQLELYEELTQVYKGVETEDKLTQQLKEFFLSLDAFLNGKPADHFRVSFDKEGIEIGIGD